jgi:hypothetical protein
VRTVLGLPPEAEVGTRQYAARFFDVVRRRGRHLVRLLAGAITGSSGASQAWDKERRRRMIKDWARVGIARRPLARKRTRSITAEYVEIATSVAPTGARQVLDQTWSAPLSAVKSSVSVSPLPDNVQVEVRAVPTAMLQGGPVAES